MNDQAIEKMLSENPELKIYLQKSRVESLTGLKHNTYLLQN